MGTHRQAFPCVGQALRTMGPAAQGTNTSEAIIAPTMSTQDCTKIDCSLEILLALETEDQRQPGRGGAGSGRRGGAETNKQAGRRTAGEEPERQQNCNAQQAWNGHTTAINQQPLD